MKRKRDEEEEKEKEKKKRIPDKKKNVHTSTSLLTFLLFFSCLASTAGDIAFIRVSAVFAILWI